LDSDSEQIYTEDIDPMSATSEAINLEDLELDDIALEMGEETEEMVQLDEFEDEESERSWITYYMSIINLSVLVFVFAAAAVCIMLIAYTIHKRRSEPKPEDQRYLVQTEYSNYTPLNVPVL